MKRAKAVVPNAKFEIYTNGDYLNRESLKTLYRNGCARLHATVPCTRQFEALAVDYNGKVVPCCHINSTIPSHAPYVLGEIGGDNDIFLLWCNEKFAAWRRSMISYDPKDPPCTTCHYKVIGDDKKLIEWNTRLKAESGLAAE